MGDTKGFSEKVLAVLLQYRNQTVTLAQICTATGFSETLVQRTVNNLKAKKEMHYSITVVIRGRAWVLRDAPPAVDPGKRIFEEIESEEHTSELQSRLHLVCRLLLEKKNKKKY